MRAPALIVSLLLTVAAALAALVIMVPSFNQKMTFLAVALDEKTLFVIAAALAGSVLAWASWRPDRWLAPAISMALAAFATGVSLIPPVQAVRLARERHVSLSWKRYLTSTADIRAARPHLTLVYATVEGRPLALDVYRPPATAAPVPAVIVIHGGGWSGGDKGETPEQSARLAAQGYAVFDIQYRVSPQPNWKSAVGDVKCAIGWVKQHAREAGVEIDPQRVTLLGRSAGGHLALVAGYTADDPSLPPSCPAPDTRVEAVISFYAPTDLVWGYEHPTNPRVYPSSQQLRAFLGGPPSAAAEAYQACTIGNHVTAKTPRTLLLHGNQDQFVSPAHVHFLAPKLRAAGVPHDVVIIPYGQHGFDYIVGGLSNQIVEAAVLRFLGAGRSV
ncbi:MAG TPA: alpha/beta hydrolase [Polyangia bacterium]|nr:alpha/beta hydrolase [Polyangia bacterium]